MLAPKAAPNAKSGCGGNCPAIVMAKRVEDIECVFGLLAVTEGAELEREEGACLANSRGQFLFSLVQVDACHFDGSRGCQCPIHTWNDARQDAFHLSRTAGAWVVFDKEVHIHRIRSDSFFEPVRMFHAGLESLYFKCPSEISVLAGVGSQGDAKIDIKSGRKRQAALLGKIATKVFGDKTTDEDEVGMPCPQCGPES
jgi:hypothetical protein